MTQTIHPIHTPCKQCVFAQYNGITQYDCALKYLDIYKLQNTEILEAYDEDKEFYVVNDKKCIGYRESKWFDKFGDKELSLDDKIKIFNDTNILNYLLVINLNAMNIDNLDNLLKNITLADVFPQKIIFIRYRDENLSFSYSSVGDLIKKHNINFPWRIQTMLDSNIEYEEILHNIVMDSKKYRFILSIDEPQSIPQQLINKANDMVHKKLEQFLILANSSKKSKLFSGTIYRFGVMNNQDIFYNDDNFILI